MFGPEHAPATVRQAPAIVIHAPATDVHAHVPQVHVVDARPPGVMATLIGVIAVNVLVVTVDPAADPAAIVHAADTRATDAPAATRIILQSLRIHILEPRALGQKFRVRKPFGLERVP